MNTVPHVALSAKALVKHHRSAEKGDNPKTDGLGRLPSGQQLSTEFGAQLRQLQVPAELRIVEVQPQLSRGLVHPQIRSSTGTIASPSWTSNNRSPTLTVWWPCSTPTSEFNRDCCKSQLDSGWWKSSSDCREVLVRPRLPSSSGPRNRL